MGNAQIREVIKGSRFFNYQIAEKIGVTESALSKWFRKELTEEQKSRIYDAISALKDEATKGGESHYVNDANASGARR